MSLKPLSKSQFIKGRKCLKRIWLYNHRRELASPPNEVQEAIFTQGTEVGILARQCFPGGELIHEDFKDPDGALAHTAAALEGGAITLYEAAFKADDILVRCDISHRLPNGKWNLIEVKSSTKVKDEHIWDLAIQGYVLKNCGFQIENYFLLHLNPKYLLRGILKIDELFTASRLNDDVTEVAGQIPARVEEMRAALRESDEPKVRISSTCKSPYPCEFKSYCWTGITPSHIHFLTRISESKRTDLVNAGISFTKDIPDKFELTENQAVQRNVERTGVPHIEKTKILAHINEISFPVYFLDFETVGYAIPRYEGTRPYQALPFQFSLHILKKPGDPDLIHKEFIHNVDNDPRRQLAEALCASIGDVGTVVAYHASFEKSKINSLAGDFPDLAPKLGSIADRIWDLETPFAKRWYCHPEFAGSSSIKKVLPALVPELSYDSLKIGKGDAAQVYYLKMISGSGRESQNIKDALLEYCKTDTLAMVRLMERLWGLQYS